MPRTVGLDKNQLKSARTAPAAAIICLLFGGRPSAILWSIRAVVVDTVKRHPARRMPHVGEEIGELKPSLANGDASPAVTGVGGVIRIDAATDHLAPAVVNAAASQSMLLVRARLNYFALQASARFRMASRQIRLGDDRRIPAITAAKPSCDASSGGKTDYCEASYPGARNVLQRHTALCLAR